jgi:tagatose-1,6-bisphosphate aldolase non-catalytic subunit AgaZ/GatZ
MSFAINRCIDKYAVRAPLMVVASRNQVDHDAGYVCSTAELPGQFSNREILLLCRDHCGPYFKDTDKGLSVKDAMSECKKTIDADIEAGFDLIHVDVSRIPEDQLKYAEELIGYILAREPDMLLEFGSENNTGTDLAPSAQRINEQLAFIKQFEKNVVYFVTQTGSFTQHTQVGSFDVATNKPLVQKVHDAGFRFKEHNADYLTSADIWLRRQAEIDALNIAPQLGTVQSYVSGHLSMTRSGPTQEWDNFAAMVYSKKLWKKWMPSGMNDKNLAVQVSGHYFFGTPEYRAVQSTYDAQMFDHMLENMIFDIFDIYTKD